VGKNTDALVELAKQDGNRTRSLVKLQFTGELFVFLIAAPYYLVSIIDHIFEKIEVSKTHNSLIPERLISTLTGIGLDNVYLAIWFLVPLLYFLYKIISKFSEKESC
jgi:hypothetical protein